MRLLNTGNCLHKDFENICTAKGLITQIHVDNCMFINCLIFINCKVCKNRAVTRIRHIDVTTFSGKKD